MDSERDATEVLHLYGECLKARYQNLLHLHWSYLEQKSTIYSTESELGGLSLAKVLPATVEQGNVWDDFTKSTLHDSIDDILHMKEALNFQHVLKLLSSNNSKDVILLEGPAGIGKTTVLISMVDEWSRSNLLEQFAVVAYISLSGTSLPFATFLPDILPACDEVSREVATAAIQHSGGSGSLFILDGWHPECANSSILSSLVFNKSYLPKCSVIVSSCPCFSANLRPLAAARIEVLGIDNEACVKLLEKSLSSKKTTQQFEKALEASPILSSVSHYPPLLEALVQVFLYGDKAFPTTVTGLVQTYLSYLFPSSDSSETCRQLGLFAFECFTEGKNTCTVTNLHARGVKLSTLHILEPMPLHSSIYKFSTPVFQQFLAASQITSLGIKEQCEYLKKLIDNPRLSTMLGFVASLTGLEHRELQLAFETLAVESLGEPRFLTLLQALFEAQKPELCRHIASALSNEIILSSLYLSHASVQAVGYFAACSSQTGAVKLYFRKCSLDDVCVGILMHQIRSLSLPTTPISETCGLVLNLQLNRITSKGAEFAASAIECGTRILSMNLGNIRPGYNNIRDPGAESLARAITSSMYLTELCLSNNSISAKGASAIGRMLTQNQSLRKLDIQGNIIGEQGTISIAEGLKQNSTLTSLNLYCCYTADNGVKALADMLTTNSTLDDLNLSKNDITGVGAKELGTVLAVNCSLKTLNLCSNWVDDSGIESISRALVTNTMLAALDVQSNTYTDTGRQLIATYLKENQTLCELKMDCSWVIGEELKEINMERKQHALKQLMYKF